MFRNTRRLTPYWLALGTAVAAHALMLSLPWSRDNSPTASDKPLAVRLSASQSAQSAQSQPQPPAASPASRAPAPQTMKQLVSSTARQARPVSLARPSHHRGSAVSAKTHTGSSQHSADLAPQPVKPEIKPLPALPTRTHAPPAVAEARKSISKPAVHPTGASQAASSATGSPHSVQAARNRYRSRLEQYLSRFRHYPLMARQEGQQGQVTVHFVMDRQGHILSRQLQRRTPFPLLNHEALALLQRAQPLPRPPANLSGSTLAWTLPINFELP